MEVDYCGADWDSRAGCTIIAQSFNSLKTDIYQGISKWRFCIFQVPYWNISLKEVLFQGFGILIQVRRILFVTLLPLQVFEYNWAQYLSPLCNLLELFFHFQISWAKLLSKSRYFHLYDAFIWYQKYSSSQPTKDKYWRKFYVCSFLRNFKKVHTNSNTIKNTKKINF